MSAERKVTQDEIDALFASTLGGEAIDGEDGGGVGGDPSGVGSEPPAGPPPVISSPGIDSTAVERRVSIFSEILMPALQERLSASTRKSVLLEAPSHNLVGQAECLEEHKDTNYFKTRATLSGALSGSFVLLFSKREALTIADLAAGRLDESEIPQEADDIHLDAFNDALKEVKAGFEQGLQIITGSSVSVAFSGVELGTLDRATDGIPDPLVEIRYPVSVANLVEGRVVTIVDDDFLSLLEGGGGDSGGDEGGGDSDDMGLSGPFGDLLMGGGGDEDEPPADGGGGLGDVDDDLQSLLQQFAETSKSDEPPQPAAPFGAPDPGAGFQQPVSVKPVEFSPLTPGPRTEVQGNIEVLLDIPLNLTVELGRTTKTIKEILELSTGAVVELQKLAGESVELLVNNKLIAKGEVVVIDENFGIRITSIISREERLRSLS